MSTKAPASSVRVAKTLNAVNQEVTIWCDGQTKVGISLRSVTGTVVVSFFGSLDGLSFTPLAVGAYPSAVPPASNVLTTAAAGSFEVNVQNYKFIRAQMTTGTGPVTVVMTASVDGSYQDAFLSDAAGTSLAVLFPSTTSSSGVNTMVIPAQANRAINLTSLEVTMVGPGFGGNAYLRIWDGAIGVAAAPIYQCPLISPVGSVGSVQLINLPTDAENNRGISATPGNVMTVQIVNLGSVFATLNARNSWK